MVSSDICTVRLYCGPPKMSGGSGGYARASSPNRGSGYVFWVLLFWSWDTNTQGHPQPVGRISREDARDRVTVWALGFQKPTGMRKPSKSAAPEDRAKLWLPSEDICRFHFRWETQLMGGGLSPTEVYVENRAQGYHYPSVTSRFACSAPWQDGTHGSGDHLGPPTVLLWTGIPSDTQSHLPSDYIPGQNSKTVVTISLLQTCLVCQQEGRATGILRVIPRSSALKVGKLPLWCSVSSQGHCSCHCPDIYTTPKLLNRAESRAFPPSPEMWGEGEGRGAGVLPLCCWYQTQLP